MKIIEIWADSFHEGMWCCDNLCKKLSSSSFGYQVDLNFVNGFIPVYDIRKNGCTVLELHVYGSYKSWSPMPTKIRNLITWGKPDFIAYSPADESILFAVEETAAVPTGNQACQRCERQYGSARFSVPYWYLVSEYGEHADGGVRRDSIWPSIAAIKLTRIKRTPCIVLHYSDKNNVEDYNSGKGLSLLFGALSKLIDNFINKRKLFYKMKRDFSSHYKEMIDFILSQWENVIDFLPTQKELVAKTTPDDLASVALGVATPAILSRVNKLLVWPQVGGVPRNVIQAQHGETLIKYDKLSEILENDVTTHRCYVLSGNAGSGKPPESGKVKNWVQEQYQLSLKGKTLTPPAPFVMAASYFPDTGNGNKHITTSKNVVYLYDRWDALRTSIINAYPRLSAKLCAIMDDESPVFLYKSCSLKPGRIFGDPFTGQLSAYSTAFGEFDTPKRHVIAYFPHQVYTQAFDNNWTIIDNKGTTLYKELVDYIIFNAGVIVSLKTGNIL